MTIPRRTLEELLFVYETNPECRDVFVEGPFDAAILRWFFHTRGMRSVAVYEISTIEIPDEEILEKMRKANNRERVVYLAEYYDEKVRKDNGQLTCLVDADFCYLSNEFFQLSPLIYSDYSCMEMYFFNPTVVGKFVTLFCNRFDWPVQTILNSLSGVLQEFFLFRYANDKLNWSMDWLDKVACVELHNWEISLDSEEYIVRFLNKNARAADSHRFKGTVEDLRPRLHDDSRYQINGHDFVALLAWLIKQKGISGDTCRPKNIQKSLALSLDYDHLKEEPSFKVLIQRVETKHG